MERQCLYTDKMSELKLNNQAKDRILQNLYNIETEREEKKSLCKSRPLVKRASFWIPLTSALCVVILVISIFAAALAPTEQPLPHIFTVENPLSASDRIYLTGVVQNAQYLPDVSALTSVDSSEAQISLASDGSSTSKYPAGADPTDMYFEVDGETLSMTEDVAQTLLNALAINSSQRENDVWSIENIRKEISFMMDIIPGYDQWFYLSGKMSYVQNYSDYLGCTYKLSYDEQTGEINMTRVTYSRLDLYDMDDRYLYLDESIKVVLNVKYYKNDEGKDVVECSTVKYFEYGGESYLYSVEVLKNTANESASKLSIYNIFERPLNELFYLPDSPNGNFVREVFAIQDYLPYGKVVNYRQIDYSEDSVSVFKIDKVLSSELEDNQKSELTFYECNGDDAILWDGVWDYYDENSESEIRLGMATASHTGIYVDGYEIYAAPTGIGAITNTERNFFRVGRLCSTCNSPYGYDYTDTVKYCPHIRSVDEVTRKSVSKTVNKGGIYTAEDSEKTVLAAQLEKFYLNINGVSKDFVESAQGENAFEKSVDEYTASIVEYYIDEVMNLEKIESDVSDSMNEREIIDDEKMEEIMDGLLLGIKSVESNTTAIHGDGCIVNYDVTVTLNDIEVEEGKKYYLAIYFDDNEGSKINGMVIAQIEIDLNAERVFNLSGTFDYMDVVKNIKLDYSDSYIYGYAYVGVVSYDEAGNVVRETTNKRLDVESERVKYVQTYKKEGHSMWYVFTAYDYLYYHIEQM